MEQYLASFLEALHLNRNVSPHTLRNYRGDVLLFFVFARKRAEFVERKKRCEEIASAIENGNIARAERLRRRKIDVSPLTVDDFDRRLVEAFLLSLTEDNQQPASAARRLSAIKSFVTYLESKGHLRERIAFRIRGIPAPLVPERLPKYLDEKQITTLITTPDIETPRGRRDRAILELFYASGLRVSELAGLDVNNVNLESRMVRVLGKGAKERLVPFNPSTVTAIRAYLGDRRDFVRDVFEQSDQRRAGVTRNRLVEPLFVNDRGFYRGRRLSVRTIHRVVQRYAGLSKLSADVVVSPHKLRHTFATHLLENGASVMDIKELLGHKVVSTTQRYTAVNRRHLTETYRRSHPRA